MSNAYFVRSTTTKVVTLFSVLSLFFSNGKSAGHTNAKSSECAALCYEVHSSCTAACLHICSPQQNILQTLRLCSSENHDTPRNFVTCYESKIPLYHEPRLPFLKANLDWDALTEDVQKFAYANSATQQVSRAFGKFTGIFSDIGGYLHSRSATYKHTRGHSPLPCFMPRSPIWHSITPYSSYSSRYNPSAQTVHFSPTGQCTDKGVNDNGDFLEGPIALVQAPQCAWPISSVEVMVDGSLRQVHLTVVMPESASDCTPVAHSFYITNPGRTGNDKYCFIGPHHAIGNKANFKVVYSSISGNVVRKIVEFGKRDLSYSNTDLHVRGNCSGILFEPPQADSYKALCYYYNSEKGLTEYKSVMRIDNVRIDTVIGTTDEYLRTGSSGSFCSLENGPLVMQRAVVFGHPQYATGVKIAIPSTHISFKKPPSFFDSFFGGSDEDFGINLLPKDVVRHKNRRSDLLDLLASISASNAELSVKLLNPSCSHDETILYTSSLSRNKLRVFCVELIIVIETIWETKCKPSSSSLKKLRFDHDQIVENCDEALKGRLKRNSTNVTC